MSKTLSERIKEFLSSIKPEKITRDFEELCEEKLRALEKEAVAIREAKLFNRGYIASSTISLNLIQELQAENQALLAKNEELQAENKSWQEMVDSTNQTNQALIKRLQENKVDLEKGEVREVERALEELKNQIVSFRLNFDMDYKPMRYLPDAAQNLINALETEKKPFFKVREEGQFEGLPPSAEALVRYDMSKPKPEIDMKEECVEPVSIWNLTRDLKDRCYFSSYQIWLYEIFINSFEQMQKDIEEIKRK